MSDQLNSQKIQGLLETESLGQTIVILETVDSTNDYAKQHLDAHGAVVIADEQTAGRGRLGRTWLSPKGEGLWMTVVLVLEKSLELLQTVTLAAGLAVAQALEESGVESFISLRWPNDVFLNRKKVCGILTESQLRGAMASKIEVGFGLNVSQEKDEFPANLRKPATSLQIEEEKEFDRNKIAAIILKKFEEQVHNIISGDVEKCITGWKEFCDQMDKQVEVEVNGKTISGILIDVKNSGAAAIEQDDGTQLEITTGEIKLEI